MSTTRRARSSGLAAWCGLAVVAAAVLAGGCDVIVHGPGGDAARAERRVRAVFDGLVSLEGRGGRESDLATACSMWWNGRGHLGDPAIESRAWDEFTEWRARKGLVYGGLGSYEIVEVVPPGDVGGPVVVAVRVDGRPLRLAVEEGEPIRWAG